MVCVTVNVGISGGCVCLGLGVEGRSVGRKYDCGGFPNTKCTYVWICDSVTEEFAYDCNCKSYVFRM